MRWGLPRLLSVPLALALPAPCAAAWQQEAAPADTVYHAWPRRVEAEGYTIIIYQPQLESWQGNQLSEYAAFSVQQDTAKPPEYGVFYVDARTEVDRPTRAVFLEDVNVTGVKFPVTPTDAATYEKLIQTHVADTIRVVSLDRLEAQLGIQQQKPATQPAFKNEPPGIIVSDTAAILVLVDGQPVFQPVQGTDYDRLLNTSVLILRARDGALYLHVFDGWMRTDDLQGSWSVAGQPPSDLAAAERTVLESAHVDLLDGKANTAHAAAGDAQGQGAQGGGAPADTTQAPSLKTLAPRIYVATTPTALIVFDGQPDYVPIDGTSLLYARNTSADVFQDIENGQTYILLTGRWFTASSLNGPWAYVPGKNLPSDFAKIPNTSEKENVKASVPGTVQAQEAVIENGIPQTATVSDTLTPKPPEYDGAPKIEPITGTSLSYVVNSASPVIVVGSDQYYMLQNGVWFVAQAANGPWKVARSVPEPIYAIPPSSPLYYVTYVRVYGTGPGVVYVGYTAGYYSVYTYDGVVVYGTGYTYTPWVGTVYYGQPVTYGVGASVTYTPYTGWAMAFGIGMLWGAAWSGCCWHWGPYPWYGPVGWGYHYGAYGAAIGYRGYGVYGPGGWAATTGNVYSHWGATSAVSRYSSGYNAWTGNAWARQSGRAYNSMTGARAAGARGGVQNVYTGNYAYGGRGAAANPYTGGRAAGEHATVGNAYTGNSASEFHGSYYNPRTGQYESAGGVHDNQTGNSAVRVGDNVYADHDGNVYRNSGGSWQGLSSSGWGGVNDASRTSSLNAEQGARASGNFRSSGFGGYDRGGSGGGGFRGRGGFGGGFRGGFRR